MLSLGSRLRPDTSHEFSQHNGSYGSRAGARLDVVNASIDSFWSKHRVSGRRHEHTCTTELLTRFHIKYILLAFYRFVSVRSMKEALWGWRIPSTRRTLHVRKCDQEAI